MNLNRAETILQAQDLGYTLLCRDNDFLLVRTDARTYMEYLSFNLCRYERFRIVEFSFSKHVLIWIAQIADSSNIRITLDANSCVRFIGEGILHSALYRAEHITGLRSLSDSAGRPWSVADCESKQG